MLTLPGKQVCLKFSSVPGVSEFSLYRIEIYRIRVTSFLKGKPLYVIQAAFAARYLLIAEKKPKKSSNRKSFRHFDGAYI